MALDPDDFPPLLQRLHTAATAAGRDPDLIEVTHGIPPGSTAYAEILRGGTEHIKRLEGHGVARVVLMPPASSATDIRPALEKLAELLIDQPRDPRGDHLIR